MTSFWMPMLTFTFLWNCAGAVCPPRCICRASTSVEEVSCHDADLTSIPSGLSSSVVRIDLANNSLEVLDLAHLRFLRRPAEVIVRKNKIQAIVESQVDPASIQVQVLVLSHNRLRGLGGILRRMAEVLVQLDLSHNSIENIEGELSGLVHLSRIDLGHNRLTEITADTFRDLVNLRYLRLEDNRIASVSTNAFLHLEHLSYLVLKGNPIGTAVDQVAFNFSTGYLSYLDLSECHLKNVPSVLPSSVRYIQLRKNQLTALRKNDFLGLARLEVLILDDNQIEGVDDMTFETLKALSQLWMSNNLLKSVPLHLPSTIQRLLIDSNQISELTARRFANLTQIQALSLMGNSIQRIEPETFRFATHLSSLDLSDNNITGILPGTFATNSRLRELRLSRNPLQSLGSGCLDGLTHLEELIVSYVPPVTSSGSGSFSIDALSDVTRLSRLELDGSVDAIATLTTPGPWIRENLFNLRELSLMKSDLTTLASDFLSYFPGLATFRIASDRWRCDRALLWLRGWLLYNSSAPPEDNRCLSPDHVTDRPLVSLEDWEFADDTTTTTTTTTTAYNHDDKITRRPDYYYYQRAATSMVLSTRGQSEIHHTLFKSSRSYSLITRHSVESIDRAENRRTRKGKGREEGHTTPPGEDEFFRWMATKSRFISTAALGGNDNAPTGFNRKTVTEHHRRRTVETVYKEQVGLGASSRKDGDSENVGGKFQSSASSSDRLASVYGPSAPENGDATGSNFTVEYGDGKPGLLMATDSIVAIGTIAGTIATAAVMVGVIVHLCRKEKPTAKAPPKTADGVLQTEVTLAAGGTLTGGRQEMVYCTPDLQTRTVSVANDSRKDSTLDRRRCVGMSGCRDSCPRDRHDWIDAGRLCHAGQAGSYGTDPCAEFASLMHGQSSVDGRVLESPIRMYKWEDV